MLLGLLIPADILSIHPIPPLLCLCSEHTLAPIPQALGWALVVSLRPC